jgi:hypothetical protein
MPRVDGIGPRVLVPFLVKIPTENSLLSFSFCTFYRIPYCINGLFEQLTNFGGNFSQRWSIKTRTNVVMLRQHFFMLNTMQSFVDARRPITLRKYTTEVATENEQE